MTDYTKADFVLTAFASREAIEQAASGLVALDGKVSANIGRAAWGLAVITALSQPDLSTASIIADTALAMGLQTGKGERHQPLSSRLRVALAYVKNDASPVRLPVAAGSDTEQTIIAKAERFIARHNVTAMFAAGSAGRAAKAATRATERNGDAEKAERAALAMAGVTAKVPWSLSSVMDSDDMTNILAAARAGDEAGMKLAEHIIRTVQAAVVAGTVVRDQRAAKAKAKKPRAKAVPKLKAVA